MLIVVTLVFVMLGLAGWGLARQMNSLADDLPRYRANILAKIDDVRGAGKGGTVEKLQETIDDIKTELEQAEAPKGRAPQQVIVAPDTSSFIPGITWLGPLMGPLGTAGLVMALVIFMLLERRDLRDRIIGLAGDGRLTVTTKAFDEAGSRVSRQLLMQSLVNAVYGTIAGIGLYFLGVPYPLVWGALGAALRFIPYLGPVLGAGAPIVVSLAALPGWTDPLWVDGAVRRPRVVHQHGARNSAVCGRGRRLASGAARLARVLDLALGTARPADGHTADGMPGGARQARAWTVVHRDADGRHAGARRPSMAITSACWRAIRARPPS